MPRLDIKRQLKIEPKRIQYAKNKIEALGYEVKIVGKCLIFDFCWEQIVFYPYSGWATGKTINDGRGLNKLLDQII